MYVRPQLSGDASFLERVKRVVEFEKSELKSHPSRGIARAQSAPKDESVVQARSPSEVETSERMLSIVPVPLIIDRQAHVLEEKQ